jgi:nicotinate-nucleotide adenylyltransferase
MTQLHPAIGILGGTFDPIHFGHLRMAIELKEVLNLTNVHLIPCHYPVHRKSPVASADERLQMVKKAIINEPALLADDREIRRQSPSYMIETLHEMRQEMPTTPLCLLLGIDAFLGFASWYRFEEILTIAHLIIAHRPQYYLPASGLLAELLKQHLHSENNYIHEHLAGGILLRPITALDISATDIRKQFAVGKNPRYLLPDNVYQYIQDEGIYCISRIAL